MTNSEKVKQRQDNLDKLMKNKFGNTQIRNLAEACNLSPDVVNRYYFGGNSTIKTIEAIAKGLGVDPRDLI